MAAAVGAVVMNMINKPQDDDDIEAEVWCMVKKIAFLAVSDPFHSSDQPSI